MAKAAPRLVMVAGPNGSGKSTLIDALRGDPRFELPALYINADELQRERSIDDPREAQQLANSLRAQALQRGADVMYETVMSHPSRIAELQRSRAAGYHITVLLVSTDDPGVNVERVALRVAAGGHEVPEEATRARYARTLALAPVAIGYADQAFVFDNTRSGETGGGLSLQLGLQGSRLAPMTNPVAPWVAHLAEQVNERGAELQAFAQSTQPGGKPPTLAHLDTSSTSGPIVLVAKHYALQYDEASSALVLHDRTLLGEGEGIVAGQSLSIYYDQGVARTSAS